MALAVSLRFQFVDSKGKDSFTKVRVPNGFDIADYIECAQFIAQEFADFSTGRVTKVSICIALDLSTGTFKAIATATADIFEKGLFTFATALMGFRSKFKLPTWDEDRTSPNTDQIDTADIGVAAFLSAYELGIVTTGGTIRFTDSRDNIADTNELARELHRKS